MKVVIAGEHPFAAEVGILCRNAGHDTTMYLVEDFMDAVDSGYIMTDLEDVDVVIELHNESPNAKQELLMWLSKSISFECLVLTSAIATSTTQAATWLPSQQRVVGFGVMPPILAGGVVELAAGLNTAGQSMIWAKEFWEGLGMIPVTVQDCAGLVRARSLSSYINEAIGAYAEGSASIQEIDQIMKVSPDAPYGPLAWADYIGLDAILGILRGLHDERGEDRYRPNPLLRRMVLSGRLGRKSGEGFYRYK